MHSALDILKKYWNYNEFRPAQIPIIESIAAGHDTLGLLTTGGGKSICFQVPAMMREGVCLVVCPLIALMKDQVSQLNQRKIPAAAYYSSQSKENQVKIIDYLMEGKLKFLYISPERLITKEFQTRLREINVGLLVIDEAHCISQWGYDFRPAYLKIPTIYDYLPLAPRLALTATATPRVIDDIQDKLDFRHGKVFVNTYFKPNLSYQVLKSERKVEDLVRWIQKLPGSGLVFVNRRNMAEELAMQLKDHFKINADYYHAGLSTELRHEKQNKWLKNPHSVLVTTNAFGMGIDNPNVNYVIHYQFPASIEAYFQECGRAGRAGQNSHAFALISGADLREKEELLLNYPSIGEVKNCLLMLYNHFDIPYEMGQGRRYDWSVEEFIDSYKLDYMRTHKSLQILKDNELVYIQDAFHKPDELQLLADERQIGELADRYPEYGQLLNQIKRTYDGIHYKRRVNLHKLAKNYHYHILELKVSLQKLSQWGILFYEASTNKPTIEFLANKIAATDVPINLQQYMERKGILLNQVKACIGYIENRSICRSIQLLDYLGEENSSTCGACDVCLSMHKKISKQDYLDIRAAIFENLEPKVYTPIHKIILLNKKYPELAVRKVLDRLLELNKIEKGIDEVFKMKSLN